MKQKVRRISKSTISVLLAIMMVVSMFAVSQITTFAANEYLKDYNTQANEVYLTGSFNSWATDNNSWKLTNDDNNHYYGFFTLSGSNSYDFKLYTDGGYYSIEDSGNYGFSSSWDGTSTNGNQKIKTGCNNMKITTNTTAARTIIVDLWESYGTYSKLTVKIYQMNLGYGINDNNPQNFTWVTPTASGSNYTYNFASLLNSMKGKTCYFALSNTDSYTGIFKEDSINVTGSGTGVSNTGTQKYNVGSTSYYFAKADISSSASSLTVSAANTRQAYTITAAATNTVSTAVSPSGAGTAYISSTSTIGTATSVSNINSGGTVYLKATANTGYTFSKWKSATGLSYANSSAATTSATVTANATATAEFTANTYTISKTNPTHAKIKVPAEAAYKSNITPSATTDLGYKVSKYKYSTNGGSTWTEVTPGSSFSMPASNVLVTAEVTTCDTYTVTLNTSGSGTVSAKTSAGETVSSGDEVNEGTVVTFTATPANNNAFTGWSGTGSASSISGTDSSKTVTINANTSVTGTFAANLIQLVTYGTGNTASTTPSATTNMNLMESTGYYRSSVKVTSGGATGDTTGTVFTVKRTIGSTTTYAKSGASGNTWWVTDSMPAVTPQHWTSDNTLNKKYRDKLGTSGTQHYVFYDPETNKIWLSSNADGSTGVKVIAKDGSFVDSSPSNPTTSAGWGNTTLTVSKNSGSSWSNGTSANNGYAQTYTLKNAEVESSTTKIKVSTTVSKANYYVYGFDINGGITKKATKNGSAYELTFSPEDIETNISNFIEITPIYMRTDPSLTDPDADPTTIRFYVRSFSGEIKSRWGGELYCYSYGSSTDSNGDWPGQPMVNLGGGTYYMDLPLGTKAITLSNAAADWIHATTLGVDLTVSDTWKTRNEYQCQSYDYDDFQYIYAKPGVGENDEDIIFDFKYKQGDWGKSGLDNFYNLTTSATQSSFPDTLTPSNYSGWEDYTDLYGEPIDLWGTKLTSNYNNNPVRVVVQGYYDTSAANNSYYATTYVVYKPSATTGSCTYSKVNYTNSSAGYGKKSRSEFLQRTASEMGLTALEGQPVQITYEYAIYHDVSTAGTKDKDNQYAERADGIWYYSETKPVKGNVIIQYADNAHSAFSDDTFEIDEDNPGTDYDGDPYTVNEGTTTHAKAYFVDNNYGRTPRAVARPTDAPLDVDYDYRTVEWAYTDAYDYYDVKAEESPDGEYTFIGWYKKSGNTYELASTDYTYQIEASANETFAARYVKTPAGQVKLAHKPVATNNSGGTGDRKVWYDVVSSSAPNTSLLPSGTTQEANGAITVPKTYVKYGKNYVLKVKFAVDPDTNSLKHGIYSQDNAITANLLNETGLESHNNNVNVDSFALSPTGTTATLNTDYVTFSIPMDRFFKLVQGTDNEYEFDDSKSLIEVFSDYDRIKNNINITKTVDYDNGDSFTINVQEQYLTDPSDPTTTAWRNYAGKYTVDDGTAETNFTGTISITGGQTIHIVDAPAGTVFQISEANVPTAYTYGGVTIDGATATNITQGKQFTMPSTGSVDMTFHNTIKKYNVTFLKSLNNSVTDSSTTHSFKVRYKKPGQSNYESSFTLKNGSNTKSVNDDTAFTVVAGQTWTLENVPVGSQFVVQESAAGTNYVFDDINVTGAASNSKSNGVLNFTTGNAQADVVVKNDKTQSFTITKSITNSSRTGDSFGITVTVKPKGAGTADATSYTYKIGNSSQTTTASAPTSINSGENIVFYNIPVGAQVVVTENNLAATSNYTFDSISSTNAGGTITGQTYTFTMQNNVNPKIDIKNKLKTRQVTIAKQTDVGTGTFPIKIEVKNSNESSFSPWTEGSNTTGIYDFAVTAAGTPVNKVINVPLDAQVRVTENNATIPDGFVFEKITLGGVAQTVSNNSYTYTGTISDTANKTITVHNTQKRTLTVKKTTNTTNTNDSFTFQLYKYNGTSYVAEGDAFTLKKDGTKSFTVIKGEKYKVVETSIPGKYTFDNTTTATKVDGTTATPIQNQGFENIVIGTSDVTATINNKVKTKNVKISKTTNYTETQNGGAFSFNVKTKADGAASGTEFANCTYNYTVGSASTQQTFANGNFTLTNGHYITILNVPVDTQFIVEETDALTALSTAETYTGVTADDSDSTDKTAHFKVSTADNQEVNFLNSKNKTLSITKTTNDTDVVDKSTPFYIEVIKTAGASFDGSYTVTNPAPGKNESGRWDSTNKRFTIYIGETINITVQNDDVFTVKEVNIPANYSLTGVTGSGADIQESSKTVGKTVTIGNDNAAVSFQNSINRHKVTVTKAYSTGDSDTAKHTVKVTVRPNGASSAVGETEYTETQFKKGSDFVVNNVPAGAYVTVAETACATGYELDNISEPAFTMQNADKTVTVTNKLQKKTVTIIKKVVDKDNNVLTDASEFTLDVTAGGTTTERTITQSENVQFTVDYGTAVNVTEQDKAGYKLKSISAIPATITEDTTITVTNYKVHDVTIRKNVDDPNCTAYFPIKVKVDGAQITSITGYTFAGTMPTTTGGNVYFDDDKDVFMLKAGQSFTIKDIIENTSVDVLEDTTGFGTDYAYNAAGSNVTDNKGTPASGDDKGFTGITVNKNIAVTIANKALHTVEIQKTTDKDTSDTFKIQVIVGDNTNLINAAGFNKALSGVTAASDHYVFNKDGKITISGVPYGTHFKVVELDGGSADFKFNQTDSTVTGAAKTAITTEGEYGYTFITAHDNVTAIVNNTEAAKYQYEVTYKYEGYSLTTYNTDGTPKVGPQRSFKASGELSAADWTGYFGAEGNKFVTDAKAMEFFGKTAPYEDDFMMDLEWETKNIQNMNVDRTNKKVTFDVTATTTPDRTVYVYFQLPYDVDANLVATGNAYKTNQEHEATTQYGNWVKKNDSFVSAPLELQGSDGKYYFQYWQIKSTTADRTGSDRYKGKVETDYKKCFYADFNMTMYQDSYVTAVYTKGQADYNPAARSYQDTKDGEARINFIENSRNQWNSGGAPDLSKANQKEAGDRIYSDFLLTFGYQDLQLNTLNSTNIKTGFVVEKVAELDTGTSGYETKTQSEYHHNDKYGSSEAAAKTKVEDMVKAGKTTDTGVDVKTGVTSSFIMNVNVDLKQLDNKNQMKYSLNMKNKEYATNGEPDDPYRKYVFRAYTYIKNGDTVVVSDPTYFTIYDMASIEPKV